MAAETHSGGPFADRVPTITEHAADRWDERTSPESVSPERAWREGVPFNVGDAEADEWRVHEAEAVVLLRDGDEVTTVLALTGDDASPSLQSLVYSQVGPVWMDGPAALEPLDERGMSVAHEVAWFVLAVLVAVAAVALAGVLVQ